jgi:hypothetical protein
MQGGSPAIAAIDTTRGLTRAGGFGATATVELSKTTTKTV